MQVVYYLSHGNPNKMEVCDHTRKEMRMVNGIHAELRSISGKLALWLMNDVDISILHSCHNLIDTKVTCVGSNESIFTTWVYENINFDSQMDNWNTIWRWATW